MPCASISLLPLPLTSESLEHVCERILRVQDYLQRPLVLENPSTYLQFTHSTLPEWAFLSELVARTDCELLLDVNNVYVSAFNHQFDPRTYIENLPHHAIRQMHIAGHQHCGDYIIDTHDQPVSNEVWPLFELAWQLTGGVETCLEWDGNIPDFNGYLDELHKAKTWLLNGQLKPDNANNVDSAANTHRQSALVATPIDFLVPDASRELA